nr:MAG TPA: hypothetical protein [Microviridae sp.]
MHAKGGHVWSQLGVSRRSHYCMLLIAHFFCTKIHCFYLCKIYLHNIFK